MPRSNNIDLIVMGAFGHSRVRELFLGGTTAYILRKAQLRYYYIAKEEEAFHGC